MAGNSLSQASMKSALVKFSKELQKNKIEHFIFFGTLLGLIRDGRPILGDDDVDFYVNKNYYNKFKDLLSSLGFDLDYSSVPNHTKHFIQVHGHINNIQIRADFYFYDSNTDENFLLEPWNFLAKPNDKFYMLKLPKPLVFPLKVKSFEGTEVFIPQYPEIVCEFLYGKNWSIPKKKKTDYRVAMIGGRPLIIQNKFNLGKIFSNLVIKFTDQ